MAESDIKKLHTETTRFGVYDFYQDFVVGKWTEDHATAEQVDELRVLFDSYFKGKSYGYIGDRINPHSVDVAKIRTVLKKAENLKKVCFVIYSTVAQSIAYIEKTFYDSHDLQIFSDLETAKEWMSEEMIKLRASEN